MIDLASDTWDAQCNQIPWWLLTTPGTKHLPGLLGYRASRNHRVPEALLSLPSRVIFISCVSNYRASDFHPFHISIKLLYLYEGKYFVLYDGWGAVFRRNDLNQNSIDKVSGGYESMEAITTVLYTCLKNLVTEGKMGHNQRGLNKQ